MNATQIVDALELIAKAAGMTGALESAALGAVRAMVAMLTAGVKGDITPESVQADMVMLSASIRDDDANADAALAEKFAAKP